MTINQAIAWAQGAYGYEISPPTMYCVGIFMFASAALVSTKSVMQWSGTQRGYKPRSKRTIFLGFLLAIWLFQRSMQVFQEKSIKANVLMLSIIFMSYWLSDLLDYIKQSRVDTMIRTGDVAPMPGYAGH